MKSFIGLLLISITVAMTVPGVDVHLRTFISDHDLSPMEKPQTDSLKVVLGQKLFFDKILSGNKDISCASCHHPALNSGDGLSLPIGVGGEGLGPSRKIGYDRTHIPRNSPEIFNRGAEGWQTMFWDSRVAMSADGEIINPANEKLPTGFDNVLAVQAMFPVTSRDEMRGEIGDRDVNGEENELALISDAAPQSVWHAIMLRLFEIPEYVHLFQQAYPDTDLKEMGFQHAANAIAAFEIEAFTLLDSPWDAYLRGEEDALTEKQKIGAALFYGKAGCVNCHSGNLMTDQEHHNLAVPQFGPGKGNAEPLDVGRFAETGKSAEKFAFRTPPLRNVATTAPYMHNGAYNSLYEVIEHHLNPEKALQDFDPSHLPKVLQATYQDSPKLHEKMLKTLDPILIEDRPSLQPAEIAYLVAFMEALTDESLHQIGKTLVKEVPSGLPVDGARD